MSSSSSSSLPSPPSSPPPSSSSSSVDAVSSAARGAGFLILLQISSRGLTFVLNQLLLRFLSPTLLGASVQLDLYIVSAHHFARESVRVACQRQAAGGIQAAINLSYVAIAGGVPIVLGLAQAYLTTTVPDVPYFVEALRIYELAAVVELLSEPAFVAVQQKLLYKTRAAAEAAAVLAKTIVTAAVVFWAHYHRLQFGVLPFAAGELAYCATLTAVYLRQTVPLAQAQGFTLLPRKFNSSTEVTFFLNLFSWPLLNLSFSLYLQSAIKYVLTQGDVFISTVLASLEDQGMYALSANYGGLIARMVFRPIEDSCRNMFAKLCAPATITKTTTSSPSPEKPAPPYQPTPKTNLIQASSTLLLILRVYTLFSTLLLPLAPTLAPILLYLVAGSRWSSTSAGAVLGIYTYSIPLLALNGVSEAFVAATASTHDLHLQSVWMAAFSAAFAGSAWLFLRGMGMGAHGLVAANCVNMALRIVFNLTFARRLFAREGVEFALREVLPSAATIAGAAVVPSVLQRTAGMWEGSAWGGGGGGGRVLGELLRVGGIGAVFVVFV